MALFNYSGQYSKISQYISTSTNTVSDSDLLKLFFSPDEAGAGHLITHGIDLTPSYSGGKRGLVPGNSGTLATTYLRGDGWTSLWNSTDEAAAKTAGTSDAYLKGALVSASDIKSWINDSFSAQDALRFKGTIDVSTSGVSGVNGGTGGFPTSCEIGDTYKVNGSGTLAGQVVGTGDLLICIKDGKTSSSVTTLNDASYWTVAQDNVEALVTHTLNGTGYHFYSSDANLASGFSIYAPTTAGNKGQLLISNGSGAPGWTDAANITAGKVRYSLSASTGISMTSQGSSASYNGSASVSIALKTATTTSLGGVILDDGTHGYAASGTTTGKYTISSSNGQIYITKENIENALGYTPGTSSSQVGKFIAGSSSTATANATSAQSNPYLNLIAASGNAVLASVQLKAGTGIWVSSTANANTVTISLSSATTSAIGGIKVGKKDSSYAVTTQKSGTFSADVTSGKYYAVELDKNNNAFVYVPWVSSVFSASADGLVPKSSGNTSSSKASSTTYLLGSDAKWYQLPTTAFEGTWRNIKVSGTEVLTSAPKNSSGNANPALNITAGGHTTVTAVQSNDAYTGEVKISSTWRTIKTASTADPYTTSSIGDNTLEFANSATGGIWTVGGSTLTSYLVWYNIDSGEYELV